MFILFLLVGCASDALVQDTALLDTGLPGTVDNDGDGYTEDDGDCDESSAATNPEAVEDNTNEVDDNCNGIVDGLYLELLLDDEVDSSFEANLYDSGTGDWSLTMIYGVSYLDSVWLPFTGDATQQSYEVLVDGPLLDNMALSALRYDRACFVLMGPDHQCWKWGEEDCMDAILSDIDCVEDDPTAW